MGIAPDGSPFGSQTVMGPGWPNVDEETLAAAAASYEALAAKLTGSVVPRQQGQMMRLSDQWKGGGASAATGEATTIIAGHESHAAQAAAIAARLRSMEATVTKTKLLVNATALETQQECLAIQSMPISNTEELVQSRIKLGLSQNIADVNANSAELAGGLGVPPSLPTPGAPGGAPQAQQAQQAADPGSRQAVQMLSQMGQLATQLPQQIGGMLAQAPQQLTQPLQQIAQPLQQLMSAGGKGSGGASVTPFSSFSNHPLAGGSGAAGGGGLVKAASLPGSGGIAVRTPLMASLVGNGPASVAPVGAGSSALGGVAPVSAVGAGLGGLGMMGHRGESVGATSSLTAPSPLEYDLAEDADDDW